MRGLLFWLVACSGGVEPRLIDGGGFVLPDGGFRDAEVRDLGHDAGPFVCEGCNSNEVCGCLEDQQPACGCHIPRGFGNLCDPQNPQTCAAPTQCVRARNAGRDIYYCSDGRVDAPCSKTADICATLLGCVCLTAASGSTNCTCRDTPDPNTPLCDRMVPQTCPNGTCVRAPGSGGAVYFLCSDGSLGQPCEPDDGSCRTSLGCTCPLLSGRERCLCSEPAGPGEPCDPRVPESCRPPETCSNMPGPGGNTTVCSMPRADAGIQIGCDPNDPESCPPGFICLPRPGGGGECEPG